MGDLAVTHEVSRERVMELEAAMKQLPQIDLSGGIKHHFAPGVYVRELFIPADTLLTGKTHRFETMNILVSGTILVTTDEGVKELTGPLIFNSKAGSKKAGYAKTDVIFLNVHAIESTDVDEIEQLAIMDDVEALEDRS